jgi:uncharacterized protein YceH (UPF0502 family)
MELEQLTQMQARVLGCLIEKKETTPEQYPLTLNALKNACNQKTARFPVTSYTEGQVGHTIRELESLQLVREEWGARVPKYGHRTGNVLGLQSKGLALLCPMMLRGPQTLGELRTHSHRLYEFVDLEDVQLALRRLVDHDPPLVTVVPRRPGQKEDRYAHLLCGEPELSTSSDPVHSSSAVLPRDDLLSRVSELERIVADCTSRLAQLETKIEAGGGG